MKIKKMKGYYLPRNHRLTYPRILIFLDTETVQRKKIYKKRTMNPSDVVVSEHKLYLGYAELWVRKKLKRTPKSLHKKLADGDYYVFKESIYFRTKSEFWEWLTKIKKKMTVWIFAYNMSFDYRILYDYEILEKLGFELKNFIVDSQKFYIKFKRDKTSFVFIDAGQFVGMRISLEKLAEKMGFKRKLGTLKKYNYNVEKIPINELKKYCSRDVEIVREYILNLVKFIYGKASFKITLSGIAFSWFRHKNKINLLRIKDEKYLEWVSRAYFGGRTEVFKKGRHSKLFYCDINSMYPYCMLKPLPTKLFRIFEATNEKEAEELLYILIRYVKTKRYLVIAEVEVFTDPNFKIGLIPFKDEKAGKLLFVNGYHRLVLAEPELKMIMKYGEILRVWKIAVYEAKVIFSNYVNYFYNLKREAKKKNDDVTYFFAKIMMNSLYGKFAQKIRKFNRYPDLDYVYENGVRITNIGQLYFMNGLCYKPEKKEVFSKYSIPEIAIFITSYARALLFKYFMIVGYDHLYYCDTDSIVTDETGLEKLKKSGAYDEYELGKLKIEKILKNVEFIKPKWYIHDEGEKLKGMKKGWKKIKENKEKLIAEGERFMGFREVCRFFASKNIPMLVIKQRKEFKKIYDKGILIENNIYPFVVF